MEEKKVQTQAELERQALTNHTVALFDHVVSHVNIFAGTFAVQGLNPRSVMSRFFTEAGVPINANADQITVKQNREITIATLQWAARELERF